MDIFYMNNIFCFIACVNDEKLYKEALLYIKQLDIPQGFSIECRTVRSSRSMASGYNAAMRESDAKYKIYMHQDVYILNKRFLFDLLDIFNSDHSIGLVGMIGSEDIPEEGVWWEAKERLGAAYHCTNTSTLFFGADKPEGKHRDVKIVDGLLIATQYDLPWREDLFDGWHFYDASQCCEFLRKKFRVLVADQYTSCGISKPWCLHFAGDDTRMLYYEKYRSIFLREYNEFTIGHSDNSEKDATGISVVLLLGDHCDTLWLRLDEIERFIDKDCYELVIVTNHLESKIEQMFKQNGIKVLLAGTGEGAASLLNRAITIAEKKYDVMLLDSRISVSGSISVAVHRALYNSNDIGAVYCTAGEPLPELWVESNELEGMFTLLKRAALVKTGSFDERFFTVKYTVYDYAIGLINCGYKVLKRNIPGLILPQNESACELESDRLMFQEKRL
jgi:hypothetical protein